MANYMQCFVWRAGVAPASATAGRGGQERAPPGRPGPADSRLPCARRRQAAGGPEWGASGSAAMPAMPEEGLTGHDLLSGTCHAGTPCMQGHAGTLLQQQSIILKAHPRNTSSILI